MFLRALRALLEGARPPPGREEGVVLSSYRANPPEPDPRQTELREPDALFWAAPQRYGAPHGRVLRAAPLPRLARHLLESSAMGDAAFVPAFLGTFRAFARPRDVLRLLLARMEELGGLSGDPDTPAAAEAKRALAELLPRWLQDYPEDFGDAAAAALAERLGSALGPDADVGRRLRELRELRDPPEPPGDPYGDGDGAADPLEILAFPAQEVAEQLTLTEADLFLRLRPYECLGSLWSQRDKQGRHGGCPSVRATVRHFNRLAAAVVTSCLGGAGLRPPQRARLLEKWIWVAQECRALRNFSSLCAVISALQSSPVHRLRHAWGGVGRTTSAPAAACCCRTPPRTPPPAASLTAPRSSAPWALSPTWGRSCGTW